MFVDMILIDSGYTLDAGTRFTHDWCRSAHERMGSNSVFMPDRGWWAKSFRIKSDNNASVLQQSSEHWWRMEQVEIAPGVKINAFAHDADWHRKKMQEAWLASPGSPGSLSVYSASQVMHTRFAEQVACEKLTWYGENDNPRISGRYEWDKTVGIKNEMGDCCVGVRLAAMVKLVGATSIIAQPAGGNIGSASASRQSSQPAPVQAGGAPRSRRAIVPLKW